MTQLLFNGFMRITKEVKQNYNDSQVVEVNDIEASYKNIVFISTDFGRAAQFT